MISKLIGPVFFLTFYILTNVRTQQFSQDLRANRFTSLSSQGKVRFPGVTRPRTQLIQPQPRPRQSPLQQPQQQFFSSQGGFQQQTRPPAKPSTQAVNNEIFPGLTGRAPRDEITLGTAANVAQFALSSQGDQSHLQVNQASRQPQPQTQFLTSQLPSIGFPNEELFAFADSRFIRLPEELREQRRIADDKEFELLQGTSARFLERQISGQAFSLQSEGGPIEPASHPQTAPLIHWANPSVLSQGVNPLLTHFQPVHPTLAPQGVLPAAQLPQNSDIQTVSGYNSQTQEQYAVPPAPIPQPVSPYALTAESIPAAPLPQPVSPYTVTPQPPGSAYPANAYQPHPYPLLDGYSQITYNNQGYSYQNYPAQPVEDPGYSYGYSYSG